MTRPEDAYEKIRAMEEIPFFELTCNSESELGQTLMAVLFNEANGCIRKNTDPLPEAYLEIAGKRFKFRMNGDTRIDINCAVFTFNVGFYGGRPDDRGK